MREQECIILLVARTAFAAEWQANGCPNRTRKTKLKSNCVCLKLNELKLPSTVLKIIIVKKYILKNKVS